MSASLFKMMLEIQLRLDQEVAAEKLLVEQYDKYKRSGGSDSREEWRHRLLIHFIVKATTANNCKGENI